MRIKNSKMRMFAFAAVAALACGVSAPVSAHDDAAEEARPQHYNIPSPKTGDEALQILRDHSAEMAAAFDKKDLGEVHHQSYFLEVAINKLMEEKRFDDKHLEALEERVQEVHHAAEDGEEEKVQEAFPKLKAEMETLLNSAVASKG